MGGNSCYSMKEHLQHGCQSAFFTGKSWEETGRMATAGVNITPGDEVNRFG